MPLRAAALLLALGGCALPPAAPTPDADPLPPGALARLGTSRLRQHGTIERVAVSRDGRLVASGTTYFDVCVWDAATGRRLVHGKMRANLNAVALSSDGRLVVGAGHEDQVRFWDTATGRELEPYTLPRSGIYDAAFSDDGRLLVLGGEGGDVGIVDVPTRQERKRLTGPGGAVRCVAISPDGRRVAAGTFDGAFRIWDVEAGKVLGSLSDGEEVKDLAWFRDSRRLAIKTSGGVRLWDAERHEGDLFIRDAHEGGRLAVDPAGAWIATPSAEAIRLWDVATGRELARMNRHADIIQALAVSADGSTLVTGGYDRTVRIWDLPGLRERVRLPGHGHAVTALSFLPDGRTLLSAGRDNTLRAWSTGAGEERWSFALAGTPWSLRLLRSGALLIGGADRLQLLDLATRTELEPPSSLPRSMAALSEDEKWTAWFLDAARITIRTFEGSELVAHLPRVEEANLMGLRFVGSPTALLAADKKGGLLFWELPEPREPQRVGGSMTDVLSMELSPGGDLVALGSDLGEIEVWETASGQRVFRREGRPYSRQYRPLAFSSDGRLAAQLNGHELVLYDAFTFAPTPLGTPDLLVDKMTVSPDSRLLATALSDTSILLWPLPRPSTPPRDERPLRDEWTLLQGTAPEARLAMARLAVRPDALPFLRDRLREGPDPEAVDALLRRLDSEDAVERTTAQRELVPFGDEVEDRLCRLLPAGASPELRETVQRLLAEVRRPLVRSPRVLARLRAVQVLELAGTPEAGSILQEAAARALSPRVRARAGKAAIPSATPRSPGGH